MCAPSGLLLTAALAKRLYELGPYYPAAPLRSNSSRSLAELFMIIIFTCCWFDLLEIERLLLGGYYYPAAPLRANSSSSLTELFMLIILTCCWFYLLEIERLLLGGDY